MVKELYLGFEYYVENILTIGFDKKVKGLTIRNLGFVEEYIHILKDIIDRNDEIYFWCGSYEIAKVVERLLPIGGNYRISLIDDFKNKDRSYIRPTDFTKSKLSIPISYAMWGINIEKEIGILQGIYAPFNNGSMGTSEEGVLSLEVLNEAKRIVSIIGEEKGLNQIEILIIISNFIQAYVQYVQGITTKNLGMIYEIPNEEIKNDIKPRDIGSVLLRNYGLCSAISNTMILLANNPTLNIDIREIFNLLHSWNVVNINGSTFYVDVSREISRNKHLFECTLKASKFSTNFLLIGTNTASMYDNYEISPGIWLPMNLSKSDFDRDYISEAVEHLKELGLLNTSYPADSIIFHTRTK